MPLDERGLSLGVVVMGDWSSRWGGADGEGRMTIPSDVPRRSALLESGNEAAFARYLAAPCVGSLGSAVFAD